MQPFQRAELALKLEAVWAGRAKENMAKGGGDKKSAAVKSGSQKPVDPIPPLDRQKELAKAAGVSHDTIHKAKLIAARAPEPVKEKLRRGETRKARRLDSQRPFGKDTHIKASCMFDIKPMFESQNPYPWVRVIRKDRGRPNTA